MAYFNFVAILYCQSSVIVSVSLKEEAFKVQPCHSGLCFFSLSLPFCLCACVAYIQGQCELLGEAGE